MFAFSTIKLTSVTRIRASTACAVHLGVQGPGGAGRYRTFVRSTYVGVQACPLRGQHLGEARERLCGIDCTKLSRPSRVQREENTGPTRRVSLCALGPLLRNQRSRVYALAVLPSLRPQTVLQAREAAAPA